VLLRNLKPLKMVKQATKRRRTQAGKEERYMQKVDRAVDRYGATAVAKYFRPGYDRTGGSYGRYAGRGAELKFFDTALSFSIDATGEVPATGQLCLIPQGVTESTRVGRKCVIRSIQGKMQLLYQPAAQALATTSGVIYLVLDKQANGAAAAATDVFESAANLHLQFHDLANSQRFVVLKKLKYTIVPGAGVSTAFNNGMRVIEWYKKCNIPLEFSSTTGAITELASNNVFLLAGCDANSDDVTTVIGNVRLRFSDGS